MWRLQDIVHFTGPNPDSKEANIEGGEEMVGAGYYYDEYVKRDGEWVIKSTGYVRIFEKVNAPDKRPGSHLKTEAKLGVR